MSDTEWPADEEGAFESAEKTMTVSERPLSVPREVPASGTTLAGRYTVLQPLGEGGMSVVLAAYDAQFDRRINPPPAHLPAWVMRSVLQGLSVAPQHRPASMSTPRPCRMIPTSGAASG